MKIEIDRLKIANYGSTKAFVDVCIGGCVIIKGCRILDGEKGRWVGVPSKKNETDGKYYPHVWFKTKELSQIFNAEVIRLVDEELRKPDGKTEHPASPEDIAWEE
jgi:DNA-binding cell septation regulator SpoVG